jgi:nitrate reductase assembly molybdenum cofactor insertion protein NarJ
MTEFASESRVIEVLRKSARWRLLGLLFECPGEGWESQLKELTIEAADEELSAAVQAACGEAAPELYHTIFGPGGPAAIREVSYRESLIPGQSIADLQAFYDAFAYHPVIDEPPDHAAVMLGFVSYLYMKEAYAISRNNKEQAAIAAEAESSFVNNHLAGMAELLAQLLESSDIPYLALAGSAIRRSVNSFASKPLDEILSC